MEKILKVSQTAQGKRYTSKINIAGDWLMKYGFERGDMVKVEVRKHKIVISKNERTELLTALCERNVNVLDLIERLEMSL